MQVVSKAALARKLEVSRARVSQLIGQGLPVRADGKVDLELALEWISARVDRSVGRKPAPSTSTSESINQPGPADPLRIIALARARKLLADAKRSERRERAEAGEYVPRTQAVEYAAAFSLLTRDAVMTMADRLAGKLAATSDEKECFRILREDGNALLRKVSKAISDSGL